MTLAHGLSLCLCSRQHWRGLTIPNHSRELLSIVSSLGAERWTFTEWSTLKSQCSSVSCLYTTPIYPDQLLSGLGTYCRGGPPWPPLCRNQTCRDSACRKPRAATEGRPYSTFRVALITFWELFDDSLRTFRNVCLNLRALGTPSVLTWLWSKPRNLSTKSENSHDTYIPT